MMRSTTFSSSLLYLSIALLFFALNIDAEMRSSSLTGNNIGLHSTTRGYQLPPSKDKKYLIADIFSNTYENHAKMIKKISDIIRVSVGTKIVLKRNPSSSHCVRPHNYKDNAIHVDVSKLIKILAVESLDDLKYSKTYIFRISSSVLKHVQNRSGGIVAVADVQAMMSMEDLVDALLPLNLIPAVVPEFKGITVGGSLQGLAAESTSFLYGFVHDMIVGFEVILGDGSILWCSETTNSDLFHSLPGSFGSLAICTRVKILCISAEQHVLLKCKLHSNQTDIVTHMGEIQDQNIEKYNKFGHLHHELNSIDFLEGIGYKQNYFISIVGQFITTEGINELQQKHQNSKLPMRRCNYFGYKWFYNQVRDVMLKSTKFTSTLKLKNVPVNNLEQLGYILLPTKDYLFRHDRGSFWMASYRIPQIIGQFLMTNLLDSTNMFRLSTALPWAFPKSVILLQDFMLPRNTCPRFFESLQNIAKIWPIWLLPMRNFQTYTLFGCPKQAITSTATATPHYCNIGVYGIPQGSYHFERVNRKLEDYLYRDQGRKVYYSHAYYDRDFFYNKLYDGAAYSRLRKKYRADLAFPEIYDKIITKDGKL